LPLAAWSADDPVHGRAVARRHMNQLLARVFIGIMSVLTST
jgi:hypothetical protein